MCSIQLYSVITPISNVIIIYLFIFALSNSVVVVSCYYSILFIQNKLQRKNPRKQKEHKKRAKKDEYYSKSYNLHKSSHIHTHPTTTTKKKKRYARPNKARKAPLHMTHQTPNDSVALVWMYVLFALLLLSFTCMRTSN